MKKTVLFDLGGTLAQYYDLSEFPSILEEAIQGVQACLSMKGLLTVQSEVICARVKDENHESLDYASRPLEARLIRIFDIDERTVSNDILMEMCTRFMSPIFERGKCYADTVPALMELRSMGVKMAILSNTSWGSPAVLWRKEVRRLGLDSLMDAVLFDRDVGWRKPSERIYTYSLQTLGAHPNDCLFVGDHPKWDLEGPRAVGVRAILIDRKTTTLGLEEQRIRNLHDLTRRL